ncbi:unnamed protein product [Brassica napus]|uniref:(rape) hypothetical protein n=1 Tax=Brassica napus TaxID=3708 RepID=A0A816I7X0_BRANA|nr:unnamed protein product [Brassica napus]
MLYLKTLSDGTHLVIGRALSLKPPKNHQAPSLKTQRINGLLKAAFLNGCLIKEICGGKVGAMHPLCQPMSKSPPRPKPRGRKDSSLPGNGAPPSAS